MAEQGLGRDFWLYRSGQFVSLVGDSCGLIAMSWWILEATGSAAKMGAVVSPAIFVRVALLPLLAPLGDKLRRKNLIILGDLWRGLLFLALGLMALRGTFHLPSVLVLYVLSGAGTALFEAGASGIVPGLVARENLALAMRRSAAVGAAGQILGGAAGGLLVTALGVPLALLLDGLSYFAAAAASALIKADTRPAGARGERHTLAEWARDFAGGITAIRRVPLLLWMSLVFSLLNFAFAPIVIGLPVLVKEISNMPPWYLGLMESALSAGAIAGSFAVGRLARGLGADRLVVGGIALLGACVSLLPLARGPAAPLLLMLLLGLTLATINIHMGTLRTAALPDNYRARVAGALGFLSGVTVPLGVALTGGAIAAFGLPSTFLAGGLALAVLGPLLLWIPGFRQFLRLDCREADGYFRRAYPAAFSR